MCFIKRRIILAGALFSFLSGVFLATLWGGFFSCIGGFVVLFLFGISLLVGGHNPPLQKKPLPGVFLQKRPQFSLRTSWIPLLICFLAFCLGILRLEIVPREALGNNIGIHATEEGVQVQVIGLLSAFPDIRFKEEKWVITVQEVRLVAPDIQDSNSQNPSDSSRHGETSSFQEENIEWKPASGKMLLRAPRDSGLVYGDKVRLFGLLKTPFESEEFSYKNYLSREGVFSLMGFPNIEKTGEIYHPILSPLYQIRLWFDAQLKKQIPPPESAFAAGILIGDRSGFSDELSEAFRITGLSHLLALSGYNITIIALAVFFITIWLPKNMRIFTTLFFLTFFVFFVGGGSSIIRAAIMGAIGLFVVHSGRTADGFYLLLLASCIMVLFHPLILAYDPSFQLSIAGVLGLLAFSNPINSFLERFIGNGFFREILTATLAAQIGVLPLILFLFGAVSIISPLANLFIVPLIPAAMLFSFLSVVFGVLSDFLAGIFAFISWNMLHLGFVIIRLLADIPGASISFSLGKSGLTLLVFLLIALYLVISGKARVFLRKISGKSK